MAVSKTTIVADLLFFIKDDFRTSITDPISAKRASNSSFIMTSYPSKTVQYPLITLKCINIEAKRAGMQTTNQDIILKLEVRIWARNEKEKEEIYQQVLNRLANIQFTSGTGSEANNLHDVTILSSVEVDEAGEEGAQVIKSRITGVQYRFYG